MLVFWRSGQERPGTEKLLTQVPQTAILNKNKVLFLERVDGMDSEAYVESVKYKLYSVIFHEGDPGSGCMYQVESGSVGIFAHYGTAESKRLAELNAGEFFGEMGMVRGYPRSATAVALESNTCLNIITWNTLSYYFAKTPTKIVTIMQQLSNRLADTNEMFLSVRNALLELSGEYDQLVLENARLKALLLPEDSERKLPALTMAQRNAANERIRQKNAKYQAYTSGA